jgi:ABC-type thiamin/hydroxymethylpyrimidine transport system permease subunit
MERILWHGVHPHGFVCGLLMSIIAYALWGRDIPVPLVAVVLCTPYCAVIGYVVARWHEAWLSAMVAAVAAVTGNVVVLLFSVGMAATVQPWPLALLWLLGVAFVPIPALLGVLFGRLGAAVRRPARSAPARES